MTGAQVVAMAEDVPALAHIRPGGKVHPIDRAVLAMTTLTGMMPFSEGNELVARLVLNGLLLLQEQISHFKKTGRKAPPNMKVD